METMKISMQLKNKPIPVGAVDFKIIRSSSRRQKDPSMLTVTLYTSAGNIYTHSLANVHDSNRKAYRPGKLCSQFHPTTDEVPLFDRANDRARGTRRT